MASRSAQLPRTVCAEVPSFHHQLERPPLLGLKHGNGRGMRILGQTQKLGTETGYPQQPTGTSPSFHLPQELGLWLLGALYGDCYMAPGSEVLLSVC